MWKLMVRTVQTSWILFFVNPVSINRVNVAGSNRHLSCQLIISGRVRYRFTLSEQTSHVRPFVIKYDVNNFSLRIYYSVPTKEKHRITALWNLVSCNNYFDCRWLKQLGYYSFRKLIAFIIESEYIIDIWETY